MCGLARIYMRRTSDGRKNVRCVNLILHTPLHRFGEKFPLVGRAALYIGCVSRAAPEMFANQKKSASHHRKMRLHGRCHVKSMVLVTKTQLALVSARSAQTSTLVPATSGSLILCLDPIRLCSTVLAISSETKNAKQGLNWCHRGSGGIVVATNQVRLRDLKYISK